MVLLLSGCNLPENTSSSSSEAVLPTPPPSQAQIENSVAPEEFVESPPIDSVAETTPTVQTGLIQEQILESEEGPIHYSFYLPESYNGKKSYPLIITMPGYDRMWFGEDSSGANLSWNGFTAWTELDEELIVVSAQLTDWGETSARQAISLTEYFIENYAADKSQVYAAGYSAGGKTMSRAVALRPDLYAAYLHSGFQWDGEYQPVAENGVAVYLFMAENDEYYGSQKARDAYNNLYKAYLEAGYTEEQIDKVLQVEIPDNAYFNSRGIYNYHGGGLAVFDNQEVLHRILAQEKSSA